MWPQASFRYLHQSKDFRHCEEGLSPTKQSHLHNGRLLRAEEHCHRNDGVFLFDLLKLPGADLIKVLSGFYLITHLTQNGLKKSENMGAGLRPAPMFSGNPCYMCVTSVNYFQLSVFPYQRHAGHLCFPGVKTWSETGIQRSLPVSL